MCVLSSVIENVSSKKLNHCCTISDKFDYLYKNKNIFLTKRETSDSFASFRTKIKRRIFCQNQKGKKSVRRIISHLRKVLRLCVSCLKLYNQSLLSLPAVPKKSQQTRSEISISPSVSFESRLSQFSC